MSGGPLNSFIICLLLISSLFLLSGCKTPYQRLNVEGGYTDTQLQDNLFRVRFSGNEFTSPEEVSDLALLRCAELAIENGYTYFSIMDDPSSTDPPASSDANAACSANPSPLFRDVAYGRFEIKSYMGTIYYMKDPVQTYKISLHRDLSNLSGPTFQAASLFRNINRKHGLNLPAPATKAYKSLTNDQRSLLEKVKQR